MKRQLTRSLTSICVCLGVSLPAAATPDASRTVFLLMAPDRGFLGNEEVRDAFGAFSDSGVEAGLLFVTRERADENLQGVWDSLIAQHDPDRVIALPLFLSENDTLFDTARKALDGLDGPPITMAAPLGESYLAEEILFDRVGALAPSTADDATLVVITAGAHSEESTSRIREDLEPLAARAARKYGLAGSRVHVMQDGASDDARDAAVDALMNDLSSIVSARERPVIVPFSLGMKYTNMMSEWSFLKMRMAKVPEVVADGAGVLPHDNIRIWLRKSTNQYRPLNKQNIGVILVPHGASFNWNETMRRGIEPIRGEYVTADAFSMVDPMLISRAAKQLEERGMRAALLVRIFFMKDSFHKKARYVLGLTPETRGFPARVRSSLVFHTVGGVAGSPQLASALVDRLDEISTDPRKETLILLGHGSGNDTVNDRWLEILAGLADEIRDLSGAPFRDIRYHTWREDWPDKREAAIAAIRADVETASKGDGTALVMPVRTTGQGPAEHYLEGLDYRYGKGFAPHGEFEDWLRSVIEVGMSELMATTGGTD